VFFVPFFVPFFVLFFVLSPSFLVPTVVALNRGEIVVVGAGAAGLAAAIFAAREGAVVRLLERTPDGGKKILISGGGRCNVLPSQPADERFVTESAPHLMRRLLRSWPLGEQRAFFETDLRIPLALESDTGKLFPASNRARDVRDALVAHARSLNVVLDFNVTLTGLEPREDRWIVRTSHRAIDAARIVLATGGLSVPATGSDGRGIQLVEALGHRVNRMYPALTPLVADPAVHAPLSGVSLRARVRARVGKKTVEAEGGFLFTHRGYSGPAILDVSHVAARSRDAVVRVQWAAVDAREWERLFAGSGALVTTVLSSRLPQRLTAQLVHEAGVVPNRRASDLRRKERTALIEHLISYALPWTDDEGFKKAEVTGGGVALEELNPRTLESRRHRGLFMCGEMLDAFGPIGGHNFAWAWATGRLAGIGAAKL
jgi:predicted Rossmann fold flavoprotein